MFFAWLVVLVVFGFVSGWQNIHPLFWWLLFVFGVQDAYDRRKTGRKIP